MKSKKVPEEETPQPGAVFRTNSPTTWRKLTPELETILSAKTLTTAQARGDDRFGENSTPYVSGCGLWKYPKRSLHKRPPNHRNGGKQSCQFISNATRSRRATLSYELFTPSSASRFQ
jgi:hypothetical protein